MIREGIKVESQDGKELGKSKIAGYNAVSQVMNGMIDDRWLFLEWPLHFLLFFCLDSSWLKLKKFRSSNSLQNYI